MTSQHPAVPSPARPWKHAGNGPLRHDRATRQGRLLKVSPLDSQQYVRGDFRTHTTSAPADDQHATASLLLENMLVNFDVNVIRLDMRASGQLPAPAPMSRSRIR
jgi:hypothetical protein